MKRRAILAVSSLAVFALAAGPHDAARPTSTFDHARHEAIVPACASCHPGAERAGESTWPRANACLVCHDGNVAPHVDWVPPPALAPGLLAFSHDDHAVAAARAGSTVTCKDCHASGGPSGIRRADANRCFACHDDGAHLDVSTECARCHRPLAEATRLTRDEVAGFSRPAWHDEQGFADEGHGKLACSSCPASRTAGANCATCHAQDFCLVCHVDAPEQPSIREMPVDPRSLVHKAKLRAPATHADPDFLRTHGAAMDGADGQCSTCHTQKSCTVCHVATPGVAAGIPSAGAGRGLGAVVTRRYPRSHDAWFRETHGAEANASPQSCAGCHAQEDCLVCHLPGAADAAPGYHPPGFLTRHPTAAYGRETSCSDCHNPQSFCASCHEASGLTSTGPLGSGYHDAKFFFLLAHGPAARRSLESCVSCHSESDCLVCHSAAQGRGFDPHGPGFDAERLRRKAPQMCTVCHGAAIPGG